MLHDRVVDIAYRRWEAPREVERRLAPYGLVLKNGTWYLVAAPADQPDGRRAHLPRLQRAAADARPTTASSDPPTSGSRDFWREHLDAFDRRRLTRTAVVRLSPALVSNLPDLSDAALRQAVDGVAPGDDGWTTVELPIEYDEMAARQLLPHGAELEVVSPVSLRDLMVAKAHALLALYG